MTMLGGITRGLLAGVCLAGAHAWADVGANDPFAQSKGSWEQSYHDQWALRALDSDEPYEQSREVIVAVIDTGVDYTHEDFNSGGLWRNASEEPNGRDDDGNGLKDDLIGWNFGDDNNNPWDESGHGSHVAGLICACTDNGIGIAAVSPSARLMPLKVAAYNGQARSDSVARAIDYAVTNGAHIINLSLNGNLATAAEAAAAQRAQDAGVLLVVAAGNRGAPVEDFSYGKLPGALIVGATTPDRKRAGFSNFGSIDVVAPGVDILSLRANATDFIALTGRTDYQPLAATPPGADNYYRASGTSFAAAYVSGLAARLLQARPKLKPAQLKQLLTQSAVDIDLPGTDQLTGYGEVSYERALRADPQDYIHARLSGIELSLKDDAVWIQVNGVAAAKHLQSSRLEVQEALAEAASSNGGEPSSWKSLAVAITPSTSPGPLAQFALTDLMNEHTAPGNRWTLRLLVESTTGRSREARLQLALPAVPQTSSAGVGQ